MPNSIRQGWKCHASAIKSLFQKNNPAGCRFASRGRHLRPFPEVIAIKHKPPINWMGNKTCLLEYILPLLPQTLLGFCEVFGGSGALTFSTPTLGQEKEIYNDFNYDLYNFMLVIKERPYELITELYNFPINAKGDFDIIRHVLNPDSIHNVLEREDAERYIDVVLKGKYVEAELAAAQKILSDEEYQKLAVQLHKRAELCEVKRAALFYQNQRHSFGGNPSSYGNRFCDIRVFLKDILWCSKRLAKVVIQNKDFEAVIKQFDSQDMFFFCDPPYHTTEDVYDVGFPESDHIRLRDTLKAIQGRCMITYNDDEYVRDLYKGPGFWIIPVERPNSLSTKKNAVFKELIILNYDPDAYGGPKQLSLLEV